MAMTAWSAKVFSKRDLLVGERANFRPADHDRPDRQHPRATTAWRAQCEHPMLRSSLRFGNSSGSAVEVMNVNRLAVNNSSTTGLSRGRCGSSRHIGLLAVDP